ncbi:hypothetical protein DGN02_16495 [Xanthomonas citri]|nr:hypothetical protein DGN02_16495 [Xanthomonas citri]
MTALKHADDSMTETSGRTVRYQPSIMRQRGVRINLIAALSYADPCTTLAWLGAARSRQARITARLPRNAPPLLKLSTSPSGWLTDHAVSGSTQTPITLRIMAATPTAAAVQTWARQWRHQLT